MPDKIAERPRVFIDKVHLKGFKSIENISVDLKKGLNVLIGKNGSGKSNFLEFLYQALFYFRRRQRNILFDFAGISLITYDGHSVSFELQRTSRGLSLRKDDLDERGEVNEKFSIDDTIIFDSSTDNGLRKIFNFNGKKNAYTTTSSPMFTLQRMGYESIFPMHLGFSLPNKLDYIDTPGTFTFEFDELLEANYNYSLNFLNSIFADVEFKIGDNIVYEDDETVSPEKIKQIAIETISKSLIPQEIIISNIKRYCPIEDLRFNKNINIYNDEKRLIVENIKLEFKINGNWMPWSQLSDGTKRLFYIVSEVTYTRGLILIEEPELGIHPHQFNLLMDFLKEQSELKQILISTHSPKALDHLSPEELDSILIASYDLKKGTQIRHLTSREITKAKKYMKEVGFFSDYWMLSDLEAV